MADTIASKLTRARRLIENVEHWTAGNHAIDNTGIEVQPNSRRAYAFCADGALAKVCRVRFERDGGWKPNHDYESCAIRMRAAAGSTFPDSAGSYVHVNDGEIGVPHDLIGADADAIAHANILKVFDAAIEWEASHA